MRDGTWHLVWTLLLMAAFVGIVFWAWSSRRRRDFEQAANLPLEDDGHGRERTPENEESP
jgi:cytochrome c oxidase cbb3-type subunit IV